MVSCLMRRSMAERIQVSLFLSHLSSTSTFYNRLFHMIFFRRRATISSQNPKNRGCGNSVIRLPRKNSVPSFTDAGYSHNAIYHIFQSHFTAFLTMYMDKKRLSVCIPQLYNLGYYAEYREIYWYLLHQSPIHVSLCTVHRCTKNI